MKDQFGRTIEYARLSVTSRCNLKCLYCNPGNGCIDNSVPTLDPESFDKILDALVLLGIKKVRLTGGEPLLRDDILDIVKRVSNYPQIKDISMTTNGLLLKQKAKALKEAGLMRVNVSLDSLNDAMYRKMTGGGRLESVLDGIKAALSCGLNPVRLNVVLVRGMNDSELDAFFDLAKSYPLDVRFIELMPDGTGNLDSQKLLVSHDEILSRYSGLTRLDVKEQGQPAIYYTKEGFKGRIGLISPMSHRFCNDCNRIRITSEGFLRTCLGHENEYDLKPLLTLSSEELSERIGEWIYKKPEGHMFLEGTGIGRAMKGIGG